MFDPPSELVEITKKVQTEIEQALLEKAGDQIRNLTVEAARQGRDFVAIESHKFQWSDTLVKQIKLLFVDAGYQVEDRSRGGDYFRVSWQ